MALRETQARMNLPPGLDLGAWLHRYLPHVFTAPDGDFHRGIHAELLDLLWGQPIDGEVRRAAAYAYPRGHGKTSNFVYGLALFVICEWRNIPHFQGRPPYIVIVQDSANGSRDRVLDIRYELESNELLRRDYGNKVNRKLWQQRLIETTDGCRIGSTHANAAGVRGLTRGGRRPSLLLVDDLENDEDVLNPDSRQRLEDWLLRTLIGTGIPGQVLTIIVGTILGDDAVLARLLDPEQHPAWLKRRFAARTDAEGNPELYGERILWPEFWTDEMLREQVRLLLPLGFTQEFLNQPVSDSTSLFPTAILKAAMERGKGKRFLRRPCARIPFDQLTSTWSLAELEATVDDPGAYQILVTAWDVAVVDDERKAQQRDTDYYAGVSVGLTLGDRFEVRRVVRKRGITPAHARGWMVEQHDMLQPDQFVVENNQAQSFLVRDMKDERPDLPLLGHTTDHKKHNAFEGIPMLSGLLEFERLDFCWQTEEEKAAMEALCAELNKLGTARHDDMVMALWMAVVRIRMWMAQKRDKARQQRLGKRGVPPRPPGTRTPAGGYRRAPSAQG